MYRNTITYIKRLSASIIFLLLIFPSVVSAEFWGSRKSDKYHYPSCKWAQKIKSENLIIFSTLEEASRDGYVACKVCRPPSTSQYAPSSDSQYPTQPSITSKEVTKDLSHLDFAVCNRVIDGDTIVVFIQGKKEKVRLIGVDTPETVHSDKSVEFFGREASCFTRKMVEGRFIRLDYDWQKRDKYRRLLAYVYLENGTFLNAEIIKQGYGFAYTKYPFKYLDEFRQYEREARESNRGLWSK